MRKLKTKKSFDKAYAKLSLKLRQKIDCTLVIFVKNPWEPVLNNHIEIVLVDVGKHSQLYG